MKKTKQTTATISAGRAAGKTSYTQRQFINCNQPSALMIGGAGSGLTTALVKAAVRRANEFKEMHCMYLAPTLQYLRDNVKPIEREIIPRDLKFDGLTGTYYFPNKSTITFMPVLQFVKERPTFTQWLFSEECETRAMLDPRLKQTEICEAIFIDGYELLNLKTVEYIKSKLRKVNGRPQPIFRAAMHTAEKVFYTADSFPMKVIDYKEELAKKAAKEG